jgi:hypothetical protein
MSYQKILALNFKLSSLDKNKKAHLLSYLPKNTLQQLQDQELIGEPILASFKMEKLARRIHPSHLKPYLKNLKDGEKMFFIGAFPKQKQTDLTDEKIIPKSFILSSFSEHILFTFFKKNLHNFPPFPILLKHKLTELLSDTGISLAKLVYFLGFFDVVNEVKMIISQKTLKTLQEAFDKEELSFINKIGGQNISKSLCLMNLHAYDGDKNKLKALILERGIYRFSQGIKNLPSSYFFFFTYFLPKEISDKVKRLLKEKEQYGKGYYNWEDDIIYTWRFLCTYSK